MSDLCKKINVYPKDPKKLYNMLKSFKIGDEYVICKHEIHNMDAFSINPKLYYKGDKIDNLKGIQLIFDMAKAYDHSSENCIPQRSISENCVPCKKWFLLKYKGFLNIFHILI